ncbi:MAG: putative metallopeptidase [Armatimonadota bacterium]
MRGHTLTIQIPSPQPSPVNGRGSFSYRLERFPEMFNFTSAMEELVNHIVKTSPSFSHIQTDKVIISFNQTRTSGTHGVYASVVPLRFENGSRTTVRRKRTYSMPEIIIDGREMLYIVYFALPRFLDLNFETKLMTVFHELYHIGPEFNGDIRRFPGKNYAHGHSRAKYNEQMKVFVNDYLSLPGSREAAEFLNNSFADLMRQYSSVTGRKVRLPRPKLVDAG